VDGTHNSLVTIANGSDKIARAQLTILYNQGSGQYQLEQTLAPDEQMPLDFGKLIHDQVPDKNGHFLPPGLTEGTYRLLDLNDNPLGSLYEGKEIVDKTYGHASYTCMICCGPDSPWMMYDPLSVLISGYENQSVQAVNSCTERQVDVTGDFPTWWTDNSSIATASGYQINGVAVGSTNHNAQSINMYWGPKEDAPSCDLSQEQPSASTKIMPKILLGGSNGTDITGTTQTVVVGQQIVLYAKYGGVSINSQSWTIPGAGSNPPTAISNFTYAPDYSSGGPVSLTSSQLSQQSVTFYFVASANPLTVTFTLNYGNNQTATATASFNVEAPTSVTVTIPPLGLFQFPNNGTTNASIEFGDPSEIPGIKFNASATPPPQVPGTFEWAQLILSNSYTYTGTTPASCNGPTGLDNFFPLPVTGFTINDSPMRPLPSADSEFTWSWDATMYFMWIPGIAGNQTIPVPLGFVSWDFQADVTQNLSTNTWTIRYAPASNGGFGPSVAYPTWTTVAKNGDMNGCP
jgi:hypothetical protein